MSTKKATQEAPKKIAATKTVELKEGQIKATKIGANFSASVVGSDERYPKKVTKEEAEVLFTKITAYNKRPSKNKKEEIIALLQPEKSKLKKAKEVEVAKSKGLKQQAKKAEKSEKGDTEKQETKSLLDQLEAEISADESSIPRVQAMLDKFKKKEEVKPQPTYTPTPRRGEY